MDERDGLQFFYFDAAHAVSVHDWIVENSGGMHGTKNLHHLESPLGHIQNDDYYPSLVDKLAYLVFSINKNHAFNDGNKRSSIALGAPRITHVFKNLSDEIVIATESCSNSAMSCSFIGQTNPKFV